jgi:hypothetical protein
MNTQKNLARFILDNALTKIDERKEPYGNIIGCEYCLRVMGTLSDGDNLEYLIVQVRPLGRDGETLFYRISLLYNDSIIQCDYNGNLLIAENTQPTVEGGMRGLPEFSQYLIDMINDYQNIRDGWKEGTPNYETYDLLVRELRKVADTYLHTFLSTPTTEDKGYPLPFHKQTMDDLNDLAAGKGSEGKGYSRGVVKYFIEDIDTNEWYHFPIELIPTVHSSKTGWDKPEPLNKEYWTKDPNKAFCYFENKEEAEKFLQDMINRGNLSICKGETGFEKRNLIITEHEFVASLPSSPGKELKGSGSAEEYLNKQGYIEKVKPPNDDEFEPTFQRVTVIRLMEEYAQSVNLNK